MRPSREGSKVAGGHELSWLVVNWGADARASGADGAGDRLRSTMFVISGNAGAKAGMVEDEEKFGGARDDDRDARRSRSLRLAPPFFEGIESSG